MINDAAAESGFFADMLNEIVSSPHDIDIRTVNTANVWIDQWAGCLVDPFDIRALPRALSPRKENRTEMLVHVLWEK